MHTLHVIIGSYWLIFLGCSAPTSPGTGGASVMLTEAPLGSEKDRERTAQVMFESFGAPRVSQANSGVLALLASGRTRGVVLECGGGVSSAVPVFEGFALRHATLQVGLS